MKLPAKIIVVLLALAMCVPSLFAQWEKRPNPNVPRLANGQPNLDAPTPKAADGHPGLSGLWNRAPPVATFGNLGVNMPDGLPLTPWARELLTQRMALQSKENPDAVRINQQIMVDTEPIEFVCNENQQFRRRIKID